MRVRAPGRRMLGFLMANLDLSGKLNLGLSGKWNLDLSGRLNLALFSEMDLLSRSIRLGLFSGVRDLSDLPLLVVLSLDFFCRCGKANVGRWMLRSRVRSLPAWILRRWGKPRLRGNSSIVDESTCNGNEAHVSITFLWKLD